MNPLIISQEVLGVAYRGWGSVQEGVAVIRTHLIVSMDIKNVSSLAFKDGQLSEFKAGLTF